MSAELVYARLKQHLANAQGELPRGWTVALFCVMPNATTRDGVVAITDAPPDAFAAISDTVSHMTAEVPR